jgi:glycosyltransferase involved in cell wall biosynthesis
VTSQLTYGVITPARNERDNLPRLFQSLEAQSKPPGIWMIVDNASTDGTLEFAAHLSAKAAWVRVHQVCGAPRIDRGGPVVRAFNAGFSEMTVRPDVVVKLDADVSMEPDYFERLLLAFEREPHLGIASGSAWEEEDGRWVQRHMTGSSVWGAVRAYRLACLEAVAPLEERMGWDGIDALKAELKGWQTRTITDLPFRHHRVEGGRDASRRAAWAAQGAASHFMGYRFSYLVLRAARYAIREPVAVTMIEGYLRAALQRVPRCDDLEVRAALSEQQRLRHVPVRVLETFGLRAP